MDTISEKITSSRQNKNLSQSQLSDLAGISQQQISKFEQGLTKNIKFEDIVKLGKVLQVPLQEFEECLEIKINNPIKSFNDYKFQIELEEEKKNTALWSINKSFFFAKGSQQTFFTRSFLGG